jgi:hypothetical protein
LGVGNPFDWNRNSVDIEKSVCLRI